MDNERVREFDVRRDSYIWRCYRFFDINENGVSFQWYCNIIDGYISIGRNFIWVNCQFDEVEEPGFFEVISKAKEVQRKLREGL